MRNKKVVYVFLVLMALTFIGSFLLPGQEHHLSLSESMRDAVLHEVNKVSLFGIMEVNPAYISSLLITCAILLFALVVRIFVIPKFKRVPGRFQLVLETIVKFFVDMAKENSPHKNWILGAYIFSAGIYIFTSTIFELFGLQWLSTLGHSITLPAPITDINAAIAMGVTSYLFIMFSGIATHGIKGAGKALKDFSLPISMSFRLFGALVSGLLVTDLVYHQIFLSFVLPVVVAVLFTLIHALIQAYVLTMLTSIYYGESTEIHTKKIETKQAVPAVE